MTRTEHRLSAIMYTDIAGFSGMMENDTAASLELLRYHNKLLERLINEHRGVLIKTIADARLIDFPDSADAVRCAVAVQNELAAFNGTRAAAPLVLRIGIHLGDIHFFENEALGEGINIAARLQSCCRPGRVCISRDVYNLVRDKLGLDIVSMGPQKLTNSGREIEAWEVRPESSAHGQRTGDKAMLAAEDLRRFILHETKRRGRRPSVEEMEESLGAGSPEVRRMLEDLAGRGLLRRQAGDRGPGGARVRAAAQGTTDPREADRSGEYRGPGGWIAESAADWIGHEIERWKQGIGRRRERDAAREYRRRLRKRKERSGFTGHLVTYLAVIGFLFLMNRFPLFLFTALGWGIGVANHAVTSMTTRRELEEVEAAGELDEERFHLLRSYHKLRSSFRGHVVNTLMICLLLGAINMVASPGVPWSVIPGGVLAIGLLGRWPVYTGKAEALREGLRAALPGVFARRRKKGQVDFSARTQEVVDQANRLHAAILEQLKGFARPDSGVGDQALVKELRPVLGNYIRQIEELGRRHDELETLINGIPMKDLERDLAGLTAKLRTRPDMADEYKRSIAEIEGHRSSFADLQNEREKLFLRMSSSVNSLKQMQIDLARMKSLPLTGDRAALDELRRRSEDLSQYLADLRAGYRELDA